MKTSKTKTAKASTEGQEPQSVGKPFPIIGIGASAGGLEALEQFLSNVSPESGMAYVIIQHLDPTQKGLLPELLQRITTMKVMLITDRVEIKPDCVYVIPPNKTLSILKGMLHLFVPTESRGMRLPIDYFFHSLALDQKEMAIAVILSGMGADGSAGIKTIKENGGIVLVQEPSTAKFESMPRNALESVIADITAPADELPKRLHDFFRHIPILKSKKERDEHDKSSLEKIIILLRTQTGNDFSLYKKNTVYRRIERRMGVHKIDKIDSYVRFLQGNPKELDILFKELLIGVTNFFRDPAVWENLQNTVIPALIDKIPDGTTLRAWVPGCSTGEEAYTLAIAFKTVVEKCRPTSGINLQIFASDIDGDAIETARKGIFSMNIISSVPSKFLSRFFIKSEDHFRINTEIRETIVFAKHNVVIHPPFTKIDIITCRNLLIYMDSELQRKIIGLFYYSLLTDGILVLGSAETLGTQNHLFAPIDSKWKIFKRLISDLAPEMVSFPSAFCRTNPVEMETKIDAKSITNIQSQADQLLLQQFSPPGVLVNQKGDIIYISGRTGKYLEPAVGKANMNIFAMLREGLNHEFPTAFRKAISKKELVVMRNIKTGTNGGTQNIDVTIQLVEKPKTLKGMVMIVFTDSPSIAETASKPSKGKKVPDNSKQLELEEELILTRQELQNIHEEMQTTQEEQKSTNEELQSANEELQSTNEELTTSKEEMQSLNEELQTVNAELQAKVDDYMHVSNDMKNLLDSTDIATLFLDKELNIRRFTKQTTKLFKLINGDIGRPFTDLVSDLMYPDLVSDAVEVLRSLIFVEKHIPTKDNRWFSIRIMPYRTVDDRISGLVLTFMNISDIKHLEGELQENEQMHRLLLNASSDAIIRLTTDWNILEFNPMAEKMFTKKRDSVHMKNFVDLLVPEQEKAKTRIELNRLLAEGKQSKLQTQLVLKANQWMNIEWSVYVLFNNLKVPAGLLLTAKTDSEREIGN